MSGEMSAASFLWWLPQNDDRQQAPGISAVNDTNGRVSWAEGKGRAPVGWPVWDYEQGSGYRRVHFGPTENAWFADHDDWSYDDMGVWPHDLTDEMEDWDFAPMRATRRPRDLGWEREKPVPFAEVDHETFRGDKFAREWEHEREIVAKEERQIEEVRKAHERVYDERGNIRAMRRAAREKVLERVDQGVPGIYAVEVRKGNQWMRWEYEVVDGKALIHFKRKGWVALSERR